MARRQKRLNAARVRSATAPGRYGDGNGLFLEVGQTGAKKWILRIQANGHRRDIGLGSALNVSLAEAREEAEKVRRQVRAGIDVVAERRRPKEEGPPTFREAARRVHAEHLPSWKNAKHGAQWLATLDAYAFPRLGDLPVDQIDGPQVRDVLAEIWLTIPETARRVRQRIGTVLDWAHAKGYRPTEAPTRSISRGLPRQPKQDGHFEAMAWQDVPGFLARLRDLPNGETTKLALEFLILTAVRSGEMRGAGWNELDLTACTWTIPAERMKAGRMHVVPLAPRALEILDTMAARRLSDAPDALVFPGAKPGRPMSDMTLTMLLRRAGAACTAHGFRSSFRDWASEATAFPREVAEAALAHTVGSKVERAYARSDLLERRRALMDAWAAFLTGERGADVLPFARPAAG